MEVQALNQIVLAPSNEEQEFAIERSESIIPSLSAEHTTSLSYLSRRVRDTVGIPDSVSSPSLHFLDLSHYY